MNQCFINTSRIPCRECAISLEEELEEINGIEMVKVDYETDIIVILYKDEKLDFEKIKDAIQSLGYMVKSIKK